MKFLHLADLHLGKKIGEYSLIDCQKDALDKALNLVIKENISTIVQRYITQAEHRQYLLSRRRTLLTSSCFHYNYTLTYLQAFDIHVVAVIVALTKEARLIFQTIASRS